MPYSPFSHDRPDDQRRSRRRSASHRFHPRFRQIVTRFPPEPNGYLHIGHAKSICLNFGIAREFGGVCNLRMDDTNPTKEDVEYVDSITADVKWLIGGWADHCLGFKPKGRPPKPARSTAKPITTNPASIRVNPKSAIRNPKFWSPSTPPTISSRSTNSPCNSSGRARPTSATSRPTTPTSTAAARRPKDSPFRNRSVAENLDLFARMKAGEFPDGARTLRAKIDMTAPNIWLRDPLIYRIRHAEHHHTGAQVVHLSDVRFRPLPERLPRRHHAQHLHAGVRGAPPAVRLDSRRARPAAPLPHQYEFARLSLGYTVMSKRKLLQLVNEKLVTGWDDPRMPTICGLRRRGVPASALRISPTTSA
jgi:glutaminyl-tRNA synthetase